MPIGEQFDSGDINDITALRDEYANDPVVQGYTEAWSTGDSATLTKLINDDSATGNMKSTADFTGFDYAEAVLTTKAGAKEEWAEVMSGPVGEKDQNISRIQFFLDCESEVIEPRFNAQMLETWAGLTGTVIYDELNRLFEGRRTAVKRAEELWTDGTVISQNDTQAALKLDRDAQAGKSA